DLQIILKTFRENDHFIDRLNSFIYHNVHNDFTYIIEAASYPLSFMPIYDLRKIEKSPDANTKPDTEDTFGFVAVDENGYIIPKSYQINGFYRLITGQNGLMKPSDYVLK
ncbi:uncharacterized protein ASCRUDRAFT_16171, partial [Ascoidea rubescens DSM 1968]